jgi:hypothetical protein
MSLNREARRSYHLESGKNKPPYFVRGCPTFRAASSVILEQTSVGRLHSMRNRMVYALRQDLSDAQT